MNTDTIIFISMVFSCLIGFVIGRWERKDSQTRMYRHGFHIGKQVGKIGR